MRADGSDGHDVDGHDIDGSVPDMADQPVRWDAKSRSFIAANKPGAIKPGTNKPAANKPAAKKVVIGPEHVGKGPRGTTPSSPPAPARSEPPSPAPAPVGSPRVLTRPARGRPSTSANGGLASRSPAAPRPVRSTRKRVVRGVVGVLVALALLVVSLFGFGWWQFSRIDKVPVAASLSPSGNGGTNYLIVGGDSRDGIKESDPNAGAFLGDVTEGKRTDTIMVLRVTGSGSSLLSIPRDLWVTDPATGEVSRINAVYQSGPAALIQAVRNLGIPVNHYLEIDFVSFGKLVDAVGGIDIDFVAPARDTHSGLDVAQAGTAHLGGEQALAYVRSRYFEQFVDGEWQVDGTADLGRVLRQRAFLQALMSEVSGARNPVTLVRVASSLGGGVKVDDAMSYFDALGLMWRLRSGFSPESSTLPVTPRTTSGGAAVLELDSAGAAPVIAAFGG